MKQRQQTDTKSTQSSRQITFTKPEIRSLGVVTRLTGEGGSSNTYDSYENKRQ
jgi:hypothetical protein